MILPWKRRAAIFAEIAQDSCTALYFDYHKGKRRKTGSILSAASRLDVGRTARCALAEDAISECLAGVKAGQIDLYALLPIDLISFSSVDMAAPFNKSEAKAFIETNVEYFEGNDASCYYDFWFSSNPDKNKLFMATTSSQNIEKVFMLADKFDITPVSVGVTELAIVSALPKYGSYVVILTRMTGSAVLHVQEGVLLHSRFIRQKSNMEATSSAKVGAIVEEINLICSMSGEKSLAIMLLCEQQEIRNMLAQEIQGRDGFNLVSPDNILNHLPGPANVDIGSIACHLTARDRLRL